jgi:hypothetical protein
MAAQGRLVATTAGCQPAKAGQGRLWPATEATGVAEGWWSSPSENAQKTSGFATIYLGLNHPNALSQLYMTGIHPS